jgi:dihydroorotase
LKRLVELTSEKSAEIFALKNRGTIKEGYYADLTVIDMERPWKIEAKNFKTKAKYSPYEGMEGIGDVLMTFVNGKCRYHYNEK